MSVAWVRVCMTVWIVTVVGVRTLAVMVMGFTRAVIART
jgi:hypothetical protein